MVKEINCKEAILELTVLSKKDKRYIATMLVDGECLGVSVEEGEPESIKQRLLPIYKIQIKPKNININNLLKGGIENGLQSIC